MKKLIIFPILFILLIINVSTTQIKEIEIDNKALYEKEIFEITQNLYISNKNLDNVDIIVNDDKKLRQLKRKLKIGK